MCELPGTTIYFQIGLYIMFQVTFQAIGINGNVFSFHSVRIPIRYRFAVVIAVSCVFFIIIKNICKTDI